jgi:hypothetical protein
VTLVLVHDATTQEFASLPAGMVAGYTTGPGVAWTAAQFKAKPGAVRIDQDPTASDPTADVLDIESLAATYADGPTWVKAARKDIAARKRLGQRAMPVIYMSKSNVTQVVNALINGGVTSGVGLWVASWTDEQSSGDVTVTDTGPFPIVACQFNGGLQFDTSVFEASWLDNVVIEPSIPHYSIKTLPPGQWEGMSVLSGIGTDGNQWHTSTGEGQHWSTPKRSL